MVVARAGGRSLAAHLQVQHAGGDPARVDVGVAGEEVHRVAQTVQRHVVAGAVSADLGRVFRRRRVLHARDVIEIPEIGVLVEKAEPGAAGFRSARVVRGEADAPGLVFRDAHCRIHHLGHGAAFQLQRGLLGRVGVGHLQARRDVAHVRRCAFHQARQAGADVGRRERPVAFHLHAADSRLDDSQAHHTLVELLFRQLHQHQVEAASAIRFLQCLGGQAHVAEAAGRAGERRQQALHLYGRKQAVAFHRIPRDGEDRTGALGLRKDAGSTECAGNGQPERARGSRPHSAFGNFHGGGGKGVGGTAERDHTRNPSVTDALRRAL